MVNVLLAIVTGVTVKIAVGVGISFLALKKNGNFLVFRFKSFINNLCRCQTCCSTVLCARDETAAGKDGGMQRLEPQQKAKGSYLRR